MKNRFNQTDVYYLRNGEHNNLYNILGAHLIRNKDTFIDTRFSVFAPYAKEVYLLSSINNFEKFHTPMQKVGDSGIWSIEIPYSLEWTIYKYGIVTQTGEYLYKADPFAFYAEERPNSASKVYNLSDYEWNDQKYLKSKKEVYEKPLLIYELHLAAWERDYGRIKKASELVPALINYLKEHNFTHVEFMPVYEHPLDDSWGYQGTGFFAISSRFGQPKDLMYLIDCLHQAGIGVIIDIVLGHFGPDAHGLARFDGSALFEGNDDAHRYNQTWGTINFDFTSGFVQSFLLSVLRFYQEYFHVDGFRVDAVANMIYYLGNKNLGENISALNFLRKASASIFKYDQSCLFIAEDSTAYPLVTYPTYEGGLGFNYKWNMGFMNDTLEYFKTHPDQRANRHNLLTFTSTYTHTENFILPFSHDEVVHGKGTLISKMPGDYWQKFANLRALMIYYFTHPGKKLLFMGQEFAHFAEWNVHRELDWNLLGFEAHKNFNQFFKDLSFLYTNNKAMHQLDHCYNGFKWTDADNNKQCIYSYIRYAKNRSHILIVINLKPEAYHNFEIGVPKPGYYEEIINSDKEKYFGSGQYNGMILKTKKGSLHKYEHKIAITLGPLTGLILKYKAKN